MSVSGENRILTKDVRHEKNHPLRIWVFTWNNYTAEDEAYIQGLEKVILLCYGREIAPTTGTRHLQGVIRFKHPLRFNKVKELLPKPYLAPCFSEEGSVTYCQKDGDYFFRDDRQQGKRTDLEAAVECDSLAEVIENYPKEYVKFHGGFDKLFRHRIKPYAGPRNVMWLWGPGGTGKTRTAYENGATDVSYNNGFWDYNGEEVIVINEVDKMDIPLVQFLKITDRYPINVNVKGGYMPWAAHTIYFTSTQEPLQVFNHMDSYQIERRISDIIEFNKDGII